MNIITRKVEGEREVAILEVGAILDSTNVDKFFLEVNKLFKEGIYRIVIDLSRTNYISSGGLSVIADACKKTDRLGGRLVVAGASDSIRELFSVVQLDRIFQFYLDKESALESFGG